MSGQMSLEVQSTIVRRFKVICVYVAVVIVYLVIGGVCMHIFETGRESSDAEDVAVVIDKITRNLSASDLTELKQYGCRFPEDGSSHWSFSGSMFYSLTVITTIGYGSYAPKTLGGRMYTVFYAMLGISVIGILMSNLVLVIAELVQSVARRYLPTKATKADTATALHHKTIAKKCLQGKSSITEAELKSVILHLFDISEKGWDEAREGMIFSDLLQRFRGADSLLDREAVTLAVVRWGEVQRHRPRAGTFNMLVLLFMICLGWILAWSALFMYLEEWAYYDSVWYSCVTLSTIGFGDFVPETISGRMASFVFITPGIGLVAALISNITAWFESWRFWWLQRLHHNGKVSEKVMVAQGLSVMLTTEQREQEYVKKQMLIDIPQIQLPEKRVKNDLTRSLEHAKHDDTTQFARVESMLYEEDALKVETVPGYSGSFASTSGTSDSNGRQQRSARLGGGRGDTTRLSVELQPIREQYEAYELSEFRQPLQGGLTPAGSTLAAMSIAASSDTMYVPPRKPEIERPVERLEKVVETQFPPGGPYSPPMSPRLPVVRPQTSHNAVTGTASPQHSLRRPSSLRVKR